MLLKMIIPRILGFEALVKIIAGETIAFEQKLAIQFPYPFLGVE